MFLIYKEPDYSLLARWNNHIGLIKKKFVIFHSSKDLPGLISDVL